MLPRRRIYDLALTALLCVLPLSSAAAEEPNEIRKMLGYGQCQRAIPALRKLVDRDPAKAAWHLALCLQSTGANPSEVIELLLAASRVGNGRADYLLYLLYRDQGEFDTADKFLALAITRGVKSAQKRRSELAATASYDPVTIAQRARSAVLGSDAESLDSLWAGLSIAEQEGLIELAIHVGRESLGLAMHKRNPVLCANEQCLLLSINRDMETLSGALINAIVPATARKKPTASMRALLTRPLILATRRESLRTIKQLLEAGADPRALPPTGRSALAVVWDLRQPDTRVLYSQYGYQAEDVLLARLASLRQSENKSTLALAVRSFDIETVKRLVREGNSPWQTVGTENAPAEALFIKDDSEYAREVLTTSIPPARIPGALQLALAKQDSEAVSLITRQHPFSMAEYTDLEATPLWSMADNVSVTRVLIDWQTDTGLVSTRGKNLLMHALEEGNHELANAVLVRGANPSHTDNAARSSMWYAATYGDRDLFVKLLSLNQQVDNADERGHTALVQAVTRQHPDIAVAALDFGADINYKTREGNTPLMLAATRDADLVTMLLTRGADLRLRNNNSATALMLAAQNNCFECAKRLIAAGANPERKNAQGLRARDLTRQPEIINLLNN